MSKIYVLRCSSCEAAQNKWRQGSSEGVPFAHHHQSIVLIPYRNALHVGRCTYLKVILRDGNVLFPFPLRLPQMDNLLPAQQVLEKYQVKIRRYVGLCTTMDPRP